MATNDINQRIVLTGEKEYNKALKEANRNLKTLKSELKAETAELGANATAQQKNEARVKSLQKQIKEQEKIVKTYKAALDEVKDKYSDNEDAIAKWEQKLNYARTSLANMKNELEGVGKSFKDVQGNADMAAVASRSVAESLGSLSEIGGAISDGIESAFMSMLETAKQAVSEIWSMIADTAAKANNWTDLASYYGTTADQIERMNKAVEWSQGNFGDFTNLLNQLAWGGKNTKITEWFGVSDANYEDKLEYAQAVLEQMGNLYKTNPNKLENAMEDIFGAKKSQQIMWFVSNLETINDNLEEYDKKGYGMGKDALSEMNDVWLELGRIEGKWEDMKQRFAAGFGKTTLTIMANVEGSIDALNAYLNAGTPEEREQALKDIETNITDMFETAKKAIEGGIELLGKVAEDLKGSGNPTAQALGNILGNLVAVLEWFTEDHMNNVVQALNIFADFWLLGKGLQMASTIASLASNLKTISLTKLISSGGLGGLGGTGGGLTIDAVTSAITQSSGSFATAIVNALTSTKGLISVGIMTMAPVLVRLLSNRDDLIEKYTKELNEAFGTETIDKKVENAYKNGPAALRYLVTGEKPEKKEEAPKKTETKTEALEMTQKQWEAANIFWDAWRKNAEGGFTDEEWEAYEKAFEGQEELFDKIDQLMNELKQANDDDWRSIEDLPSEWWQHQGGNSGNTDGLTSVDAENMTGAVRQMPAAVAKALNGLSVRIDGQTAGYIVAPYVSQYIASQTIGG